MRTQLLAIALASAFVPGAMAQHQAHQAGAPQTSGEIAQCAQGQPVVANIIAAAMARLESARQSNSPAEMRAAVDHLEASLRDIRTQLAPCSARALSTTPPAGHTMPAMQPPPAAPAPGTKTPAGAADPHAGHTLPAEVAGQQSEKQMDPVNGLMVDPATAPKTSYQGQMYYFSSEQSRNEFLGNPAKFAKRPKG